MVGKVVMPKAIGTVTIDLSQQQVEKGGSCEVSGERAVSNTLSRY